MLTVLPVPLCVAESRFFGICPDAPCHRRHSGILLARRSSAEKQSFLSDCVWSLELKVIGRKDWRRTVIASKETGWQLKTSGLCLATGRDLICLDLTSCFLLLPSFICFELQRGWRLWCVLKGSQYTCRFRAVCEASRSKMINPLPTITTTTSPIVPRQRLGMPLVDCRRSRQSVDWWEVTSTPVKFSSLDNLVSLLRQCRQKRRDSQ